ncbi:MAG: hypothetical protein U1F43_02550 [Myxococcota bacterium]
MRVLVGLTLWAAACGPDSTGSTTPGNDAATTATTDRDSASSSGDAATAAPTDSGAPPDDSATTTSSDSATATAHDTSSGDSSTPPADTAVAPDPDATWFSAPMPWTRPVDGLDPSAESEAIIGDLADNGGWGNGNFFQIDFSIDVLEADASDPVLAFEPTDDWYDVECDPGPMPVPAGGAVEGEDTYECAGDGDCHLIVRDGGNRMLYEMWRANIVDGTFYGGCLAIWDLDRAYGPEGRGLDCSSADAAGLPIAPLLFTAEEVASGHIDHAIRFILPNPRIRHRVYVAPGTHSTNPTDGGPDAPPYGVRFRLRGDYPLETLPNDGARTVARALQKYGMFLADAGQIALTARSDRYGTASWDGLLGPRDLGALSVDDFEVVELGTAQDYHGDCVRQ